MSTVWTAAATFVLFSPPDPLAGKETAKSFSAAHGSILSDSEFDSLWKAFFNTSYRDRDCGMPKNLANDDAQLMAQDAFLVNVRGFNREICQAQRWWISSLRIDPCRVRHGKANQSSQDVEKCSQDGRYKEIRFVLQPVVQTDRGAIFPDAALHLALSLKNFSASAPLWREAILQFKAGKIERLIQLLQEVRQHGVWNDASLMVAGAGLERWSFARVLWRDGVWQRDKLSHGGFYESISDADAKHPNVRTARPANEASKSSADFLNPLKTTPLQGSCVGCHLANPQTPSRQFRQLGWGLSGEPVLSKRAASELELAAQELNL